MWLPSANCHVHFIFLCSGSHSIYACLLSIGIAIAEQGNNKAQGKHKVKACVCVFFSSPHLDTFILDHTHSFLTHTHTLILDTLHAPRSSSCWDFWDSFCVWWWEELWVRSMAWWRIILVLNFLRDGIFMIIVAWFFLFCFFYFRDRKSWFGVDDDTMNGDVMSVFAFLLFVFESCLNWLKTKMVVSYRRQMQRVNIWRM